MINPDHALFAEATEAPLSDVQPVPGDGYAAQFDALQDEWGRQFEAGMNPDPFGPGGPWE